MSWSLLDPYRLFGGKCCLSLQDGKVNLYYESRENDAFWSGGWVKITQNRYLKKRNLIILIRLFWRTCASIPRRGTSPVFHESTNLLLLQLMCCQRSNGWTTSELRTMTTCVTYHLHCSFCRACQRLSAHGFSFRSAHEICPRDFQEETFPERKRCSNVRTSQQFVCVRADPWLSVHLYQKETIYRTRAYSLRCNATPCSLIEIEIRAASFFSVKLGWLHGV